MTNRATSAPRLNRSIPLLVLLAAVVSALLLLLAGGAEPATAGGEPAGERGERERVHHAKRKRRRYPPARLWYRVSAEFTGQVELHPGPYDIQSEFSAGWDLRSRTAVRLTLLCVNRRSPDKPFQIEKRVRGKLRRVGGCPKPTPERPRRNLYQTVRFAAGAHGELYRWEHEERIQSPGCSEQVTDSVLDDQGLEGTIKSPSTAIEGISISVRTASGPDAGDAGTVTTHGAASECVNETTGEPYPVPAFDRTRDFQQSNLFGGESWIGETRLSKLLRVRVPSSSFGHPFSVPTASASIDPSLQRPLPPAGPYFYDPTAGKEYRWKVQFDPCPRRGRDVEGC